MNEAMLAYAAFPDRIFAVQNGVVKHIGHFGQGYFDIKALEDWLKKTV